MKPALAWLRASDNVSFKGAIIDVYSSVFIVSSNMLTDVVLSLQLLFPEVTHHMGIRHIVRSDAILEWKDTGILIIDDISFVGYEDLRKLDRHLSSLTEAQTKAHGGNVHIVFPLDFFQLKLIPANPFYALSATPLSISAPGNVHLRAPSITAWFGFQQRWLNVLSKDIQSYIYNNTESYASVVETQSRGGIHLHIIVLAAIDEVPMLVRSLISFV
jgi:hypothetical protein